MAGYPKFCKRYATLPSSFYESVEPTPVANPCLIWGNGPLGQFLGMEQGWQDTTDALGLFSGNHVQDGSAPLAMAYAGHQFGHFVPQLGDGRAILLGELLGHDGQLYEVQLKGAGQTAFSRRGDGRAAIGPVIRETLLSEAMFALGVPTTRVLATLSTGETVVRDRALPGGIVVRVAKSHIRFGTFEYFAAREDKESLRALVDFVMGKYYVDFAPVEWADLDAVSAGLLGFFDGVMARQIALVSKWMGIGFIHGVMNTDNMSITGDTIDYGPAAFLDEFNPEKVFSYIDTGGRYSYGNQAAILRWNLGVLGHCLSGLFEEGGSRRAFWAHIESRLEAFEGGFARAWQTEMGRKFGLTITEGETDSGNSLQDDGAIINEFLGILDDTGADFTVAFRGLYDAYVSGELGVMGPTLERWWERWQARLVAQGDSQDVVAERMRVANPYIIPRNHQIERVIQAAEAGEYGPFYEMMLACEAPYETRGAFEKYAMPPEPDARVKNTFCGT
ncbi:MAG: YdiU family protein [bacterium]|nr:YdiU family protein [bacterium]